MNALASAHPLDDSWVAAIHASESDFEPLGTAVVVDMKTVLTCAHVVVMTDGAVRESLWVAFPKVSDCPRRRVAEIKTVYSPPVKDLAALVLEEPVPEGVAAAPLRDPPPAALVKRAWWAFGFPNRDPVGNSANGEIGASLSYGWVRLDTASRYLVEHGFSGGALWSQDYQAVVGVVGQAHRNGDGRAITMFQANKDFPDLAKLASWSVEAAGEVALTQWGWTLARDPEGVRHWRPRARGVSVDSERGYRFRGRSAALNRIVRWLDRAVPDRRVLVVTGSPGVGKSAVLGRIVTTADAAIQASLPISDQAVRASVGSVGCAVHAKGKSALEVAEEIARAASAELPQEPGDLAPIIRDALGERGGRRFNVIIDALDEAVSPAEARVVIDQIVLPLVETCSDTGAQVIVGTRRHDDMGDMLGRFGGALSAINLDSSENFSEEDLADYALACLQLTGDERVGNPYADETAAIPLAERIAAVSDRNFLVAGLLGRAHGLHDEEPADPEELRFTVTVDAALNAYLSRLSPVGGLSADHVLTALAFAEAPGLPVSLWQLAVEAIYGTTINIEHLARFVRSAAANFLVETSSEITGVSSRSGRIVYRLFHQALNDVLLRARSEIMERVIDERTLSVEFARSGRLSGWENAPDYLLRSLPHHAAVGGLIDDLLADDAYLMYADLRRLIQAADDATTAQGQSRSRLLRLTTQAISAGPGDRAALFSVTEALEDLGDSFRSSNHRSYYRARWASVTSRTERTALEGHVGAVHDVCSVNFGGRVLLASAGADRTIRIWDLLTGQQQAVLEGHESAVYGVCPLASGRALLASAGADGTVRIWEFDTGRQYAVLPGHRSAVHDVCPVEIDGQELLASAGTDGTVRIWDLATSKRRNALQGHRGFIHGVCSVNVGGRALLASAGADGTVRIWDPNTGQQQAALEGHEGAVYGLHSVVVADRELLASAGAEGMVRIWDPAADQLTALEDHGGAVYSLCEIILDKVLLASAGADGAVRIWDPITGQHRIALRGHQGAVYSVCSVSIGGRASLASAGADGTVRTWDPLVDQQAVMEGHGGAVYSVCLVSTGGRSWLASAGADGIIRIWEPVLAQQNNILEGHRGPVYSVCQITRAGQIHLTSGGADGTVRIWRDLNDKQSWSDTLQADQGSINVVFPTTFPITGDHDDGLASADAEGTLRLWNIRAGVQQMILRGHQGQVHDVCQVTTKGRQFLASAGHDRTVRIWDPAAELCLLTIPTHHPALAIAWVADSLFIGLTAGILMVKLYIPA